MARPQIRPRIFIALQNGLAMLIFAPLLAAELSRRLLYVYPQSGTLWWISGLVNHTVLPVLQFAERYLPTPDKLLAGLAAGVLIPLAAWWSGYWFATAVAGHVALGALIILTSSLLYGHGRALAALDLPEPIQAVHPMIAGYLLLVVTLFVLVMCIADHVAFIRYIVSLFGRRGKPR